MAIPDKVPLMTDSPSQPMLTGRFQQAFALASQVHATQVRKRTTIPYLAHLMSVAAIVLEYGGSEDAAIAGLLHHAVEDGDDGAAIERQIRDAFGDHVTGIVLGCSDSAAVPGQRRPPWRERRERYLAHLAGETSPDVLLVSACDKLHNTRSIRRRGGAPPVANLTRGHRTAPGRPRRRATRSPCRDSTGAPRPAATGRWPGR